VVEVVEGEVEGEEEEVVMCASVDAVSALKSSELRSLNLQLTPHTRNERRSGIPFGKTGSIGGEGQGRTGKCLGRSGTGSSHSSNALRINAIVSSSWGSSP
jgi:hypothetical protein